MSEIGTIRVLSFSGNQRRKLEEKKKHFSLLNLKENAAIAES